MRLDRRMRDRIQESLLVSNRILVAALMVVVLIAVLLVRLFYLQIVSYEHFATLSEDNRVKLVPVPPTRGRIYDRRGVLLADNQPSFSLEVVPESVGNLDATVRELEQVVEVRPADLARFRLLLKRRRPFESVPLRLNLGEEEVASFAVNRHRFPGVEVEARLSRYYPLGAPAVHVVGYVGRVDEQDLQVLDSANYAGTTHVGKTGVEKAYEADLHGRVGYEQVESNAAGRLLRVLSHQAPLSGKDVYLHLDMALQLAAENALGAENGAVVVIEPQTGAVLALVSKPGFDPNPFVNGIDVGSYRSLQRSRDRPLYNRALRGQYPPGSTLKPFVALAGLFHNVPLAHGTTHCRGFYQLPGSSHRYRDWKKEGHGRVDLELGIMRSCDVFFYQMALALGIDRLHGFLASFGFGEPSGVDIGGELSGLAPSPAWKRKARKQDWYAGETIITGIGQGYMLTTPIQLASGTAALATRGRRMLPRVVRALADQASRRLTPVATEAKMIGIPENSRHWGPVIQGMIDVVHSPGGTAQRIAAGAAYRIAGKTGTAQVFSLRQNQKYNEKAVEKHLRDHALFIAFAPAEEPRLAVAVLVENGGAGSRAAAPVARQVLDHYLLGEADKAAAQPAGTAEPETEEADDE